VEQNSFFSNDAQTIAKGSIMTKIREIMQTNVATVRTEATLAEAARIFTEHQIDGAPVVDEAGVVVGIITEHALIDCVFDPSVRFEPVTRFMTREVHSVGPDDPLARAAQLFALCSFRRLPVADQGKLVGLITRRDLINHALATNELMREPLVDLIPALAPLS
jgi:CBS domain-containing protein